MNEKIYSPTHTDQWFKERYNRFPHCSQCARCVMRMALQGYLPPDYGNGIMHSALDVLAGTSIFVRELLYLIPELTPQRAADLFARRDTDFCDSDHGPAARFLMDELYELGADPERLERLLVQEHMDYDDE